MDRDPERGDERRARAAKARHADRLRAYPNVTGVGVGLRLVGGRRTDEASVRVYVSRKLPETELRGEDILPRAIDGVPIDVVEGDFTFLQTHAPELPLSDRTGRRFPFLNPGVSVGGLRVSAGTLGAAVYDVSGGGQMLLSNWHVLCGDAAAVPGDAIVQPGVFDGGEDPRDRVAMIERFAHTDLVDAAVARVDGNRFLGDAIAGIGLVRGVGRAFLGARVRKSGRTTGLTAGIVEDVSADLDVGGLWFRDQMVVGREPGNRGKVGAGGDSGSLVVDEMNLAVGLLFAGPRDNSGTFYVANHIQDVIDALRIRFTPEPSPLQVETVLLGSI